MTQPTENTNDPLTPAGHHVSIDCRDCRSGFWGGAQAAMLWLTEHIHPDPPDEDDGAD